MKGSVTMSTHLLRAPGRRALAAVLALVAAIAAPTAQAGWVGGTVG
jgi:hypothetical protein